MTSSQSISAYALGQLLAFARDASKSDAEVGRAVRANIGDLQNELLRINPREVLPMWRVRARAAGRSGYAYIDIKAKDGEEAARLIMERHPGFCEAMCIGPSPAGAKDGDRV